MHPSRRLGVHPHPDSDSTTCTLAVPGMAKLDIHRKYYAGLCEGGPGAPWLVRVGRCVRVSREVGRWHCCAGPGQLSRCGVPKRPVAGRRSAAISADLGDRLRVVHRHRHRHACCGARECGAASCGAADRWQDLVDPRQAPWEATPVQPASTAAWPEWLPAVGSGWDGVELVGPAASCPPQAVLLLRLCLLLLLLRELLLLTQQ